MELRTVRAASRPVARFADPAFPILASAPCIESLNPGFTGFLIPAGRCEQFAATGRLHKGDLHDWMSASHVTPRRSQGACQRDASGGHYVDSGDLVRHAE